MIQYMYMYTRWIWKDIRLQPWTIAGVSLVTGLLFEVKMVDRIRSGGLSPDYFSGIPCDADRDERFFSHLPSEWVNIALRGFLHNHGNIAIEGSPKSEMKMKWNKSDSSIP